MQHSESCRAEGSATSRINQPNPHSRGLLNANVNGSPVADLLLIRARIPGRGHRRRGQRLSIAASFLTPFTPPATGEARAATHEDDAAFASLLEAKADVAGSPVRHLQTRASGEDARTSVIAPLAIAANTAASDPTAAPATADGAAAALNGPPGSAVSGHPVTSLQSAAAAATIEPDSAATVADTGAGVSQSGTGESSTTSVAPAGALAVPLATTATATMAQTTRDLLTTATQAPAEIHDSATASEAGLGDTPDAVPANPSSRASTSPAPNQPAAAAAAAAAQPAPPPNDAGPAKPDFAAILGSQSTPGTDAQSQTSMQSSETTRTTPTPAALQAAPAATIQVYNRIVERADGRAQRFEIRLDPAELGRVDIRIEIGTDRKVHAVLAAHDSAALSDLMRGQRALERALADAGIDLADKGVRFELARDNGSGSASQQRDSNGRPAQGDVWRRFDTMTMPVTDDAAAAARPSWHPQRLDLVA